MLVARGARPAPARPLSRRLPAATGQVDHTGSLGPVESCGSVSYVSGVGGKKKSASEVGQSVRSGAGPEFYRGSVPIEDQFLP